MLISLPNKKFIAFEVIVHLHYLIRLLLNFIDLKYIYLYIALFLIKEYHQCFSIMLYEDYFY